MYTRVAVSLAVNCQYPCYGELVGKMSAISCSIPTTAKFVVQILIAYMRLLLDTQMKLPVVRFNPVGRYMVLVD